MEDFFMYFNYPINESVQEGDLVYYVKVASVQQGGFNVATTQNPIYIGKIKKIEHFDVNYDGALDQTRISTSINPNQDEPVFGDFILFKKDRRANVTSAKGYYGEMTIVNDSKEKAELFTVACETLESSK